RDGLRRGGLPVRAMPTKGRSSRANGFIKSSPQNRVPPAGGVMGAGLDGSGTAERGGEGTRAGTTQAEARGERRGTGGSGGRGQDREVSCATLVHEFRHVKQLSARGLPVPEAGRRYTASTDVGPAPD